MEARLREVLAVPEGRSCRLWHRYMTNTYELLEKPQQTLQDVGLFTGQVQHFGMRTCPVTCVCVCVCV